MNVIGKKQKYLDVSRQSVSKWELNKTLPDVEKLGEPEEKENYDVKGENSQRILANEYNMEYSAKKSNFLIGHDFQWDTVYQYVLCYSKVTWQPCFYI